MDYKIAAIIVTFNRKDLLKKCIANVLKQTYMPSSIYIIDNASIDGTELLFESKQFSSPLINYIRLKENGGGALGFYEGIKRAHETNMFDGYWVMDDDGQPDIQCLENLVKKLSNYDYLAPVVLDVSDKKRLAFNYNGSFDYAELTKIANNNVVDNWACPFNGILYSKKMVSQIGYPKKDMFIWGDEVNYHMRAKKAGFIPYMILDAIHYHPQEKTLLYKAITRYVIYVNNPLKTYCFHRNLIYNNKDNWNLKNIIGHIGNYSYFLLVKKMKLSLFLIFCKACIAGYNNNFKGHKKYLK